MPKKWDWPFPNVGKGHFLSGQLFGYTDYLRAGGYYHDGVDFGTADHPGTYFHAIHGGEVVAIGYIPGYDEYVITKDSDGIYVMYQEFGGRADVRVRLHQQVNTGDIIGRRSLFHVHIGINRKYPTSANPWAPDGWIDPITTIEKDSLGAGGGAGNNKHHGSSHNSTHHTDKNKSKAKTNTQDCFSLLNYIDMSSAYAYDKWLH